MKAVYSLKYFRSSCDFIYLPKESVSVKNFIIKHLPGGAWLICSVEHGANEISSQVKLISFILMIFFPDPEHQRFVFLHIKFHELLISLKVLVVVQSPSCIQLCNAMDWMEHSRPPCPSLSPRLFPSSSSLHWWCHSAISSSDALFSLCPWSFPASGLFQ